MKFVLFLLLILLSFKSRNFKEIQSYSCPESNISIGIADTGIDSAFFNNNFKGFNFITKSSSIGNDSYNEMNWGFHGTKVLDVLMSSSLCEIPNKNIYDLKIFETDKVSKFLHGKNREESFSINNEDVNISLIDYSIKNKIKVINYSASLFDVSKEEIYMFNIANDNGIVFIFSAGNNNQEINNSSNHICSLNLENVICVGGLDLSGKKWLDSNYGPSIDIYSLAVHEEYEGTSFSAPVITSRVFEVKRFFPYLRPKEIKEIIKKYKSNYRFKNFILNPEVGYEYKNRKS